MPDPEYNSDGTLKNPVLATPKEEDLGPPGMPPTTASDGPWSTEAIPPGWSRFPTEEEVEYLNKKYPQTGGAPYQPGAGGVGGDRTSKDAIKDAGAPPSHNANRPDTYGKHK